MHVRLPISIMQIYWSVMNNTVIRIKYSTEKTPTVSYTNLKHMNNLKHYVNVAINKDYMDVQKYAFRKYKIKSVEGRHSPVSYTHLDVYKRQIMLPI